MNNQFHSSLSTYTRPDLFPTEDDDEELFGIMAECVDLLEQGESSRPYIPRMVIERDRYGADERLMAAYFNENPKYSLKSFRRRFRMPRPMFMRIVNDIISYPSRNPGPVPLHFQRMQDKQFDARGKPGMNICVDQHQRTYNACTLDIKSFMASQACLEALIACTGLGGTVPRHSKSPLFREIIEDRAPDSSFTVNGTHYKKGYYLADGIYPEWSNFVKSYSCPQDEKRKKFKKFQESAWKDVERAFGGLQNSWHILTQPARSKSVNQITRTMYACVILHNMKVEDAGYAISSLEDGDDIDPIVLLERTFEERIALHQRTGKELRDRNVHHALRHDLTEHIWRLST
uniref:uncharacterized protein LOC122592143 n=1 Tax=Erigeron canadensis TaxID=72917 RepID=UPI001CB8D002|nr:uncharacterized protein LOC122592143 [Erigeron canadensis]